MTAEPFGPYLPIDAQLANTNLKDRIHLVGVELEGGWNYMPPGTLRPIRDGSIKFTDLEHAAGSGINYMGEIPLPPLGTKEFPKTMKLYYPHVVNSTCGMHVHLSTRKAFTYQRLMVNKPFSYPATIVEYMTRWAIRESLPAGHPIWPRLQGQNEFCQHVFQADEQAKTASKDFDHHRHGHRYTVISYCWGRYKTVECRLLPMMKTSTLGVAAIQEVINITNAFLAASREREPKFTTFVEESHDQCTDELKSFV